jgi:hypothetical protein
MSIKLYKASERTVRKACNKCGSTDLYWANVGSPDSRDVVLIDALHVRHFPKGAELLAKNVHPCHTERLAKLTGGETVDSETPETRRLAHPAPSSRHPWRPPWRR